MPNPSNSKNGMTDEEKAELDEAYNACHSHTNTSVLAAITAAFTAAMKTVVNNLINGIVSGALSVSGYTKLGESATAIKTLLVEGDTPALGSTGSYTTGLTKGNIVAFSIIISDSDGSWILPDSGISGTDNNNYQAYIKADGKLYIYIPSASSAVYGCAFAALITYKE